VYYFGSVLSLIISVLCPVIVFVVTHDPLLIILMECLCGYIVSCDIGIISTKTYEGRSRELETIILSFS